MKDVVSCDKSRGAANRLWSGNFRMGEPILRNVRIFRSEIKNRGEKRNRENWNISVTRGREKDIYSPSSGERTGNSLNLWYASVKGVAGPQCGTSRGSKSSWKAAPKKVIVLYAKFQDGLAVSQVMRDTWNPVWIRPAHGPRLNTNQWPIVHKYCEGKLKRTLLKGVK